MVINLGFCWLFIVCLLVKGSDFKGDSFEYGYDALPNNISSKGKEIDDSDYGHSEPSGSYGYQDEENNILNIVKEYYPDDEYLLNIISEIINNVIEFKAKYLKHLLEEPNTNLDVAGAKLYWEQNVHDLFLKLYLHENEQGPIHTDVIGRIQKYLLPVNTLLNKQELNSTSPKVSKTLHRRNLKFKIPKTVPSLSTKSVNLNLKTGKKAKSEPSKSVNLNLETVKKSKSEPSSNRTF